MSAPTTPDLVTLRLPRDVAREYLRALEALISEADDASTFIVRHVSRGHDATDLINAMTETQPLRDALARGDVLRGDAVTLRCEEMQSCGRYVRVSAHASVFCCDHRDERMRGCDNGHLVGLGMGDSVSTEEIADAEAIGWFIGDRDYCPEHAGAHREDDGDETKGVQS